ncbi:MAG: Kelch repeat-containing protein [Myxococcaceae bacterium]
MRSASGFTAFAGGGESRGRLRLELPSQGEGTATLSLGAGWAVQLHERGTYGAGREVGRAVAYARSDGTAYWRTTEGGYEEWVLLSDAHEGRSLAWEVQGATLKQDGDAVLILDGTGHPRLRVSAPQAFGVDGSAARVWLKAEDQLVVLYTTARGPTLVDPLWTPTGSMTTPRYAHTGTLLAAGKVLVAGGAAVGNASTELYDPASQSWTATGAMATPRKFHTATLLPSGDVLVVGGLSDNGTPLGTAELYQPTLGTWRGTGSLATARSSHTATLLPSGKVLVTGGGDSSGSPLASAELYDPASETWTAASPMTAARLGATATLLASGQVLLVGGLGATGTSLGSAELFDPTQDSWTATGPLAAPRSSHSATLLSSGNVLVAGGLDASDNPLASTEVYDVTAGTFSGAGAMASARFNHTASLLLSGRVLVVGGRSSAGAALLTAETYDAVAGWNGAGSTLTAHVSQTASVLASGLVLVAGGLDASNSPTAVAESYDELALVISPESATLQAGQSLTFTVSGGSGTGLTWAFLTNASAGSISPSGVYTAGEVSGVSDVIAATDSLGNSASATIAVLPMAVWTPVGAMTTGRVGHSATLLSSGLVLVAGGNGNTSRALNTTEVFDPTAQLWNATGSLTVGRSAHTAVMLGSGDVLVAGGVDASGNSLASTELFSPTAGTWSVCGPLSFPRSSHTMTLLASGEVLVAGGIGTAGAAAELFETQTNSWLATGSLATARSGHTATLLNSGQVLVVGGTDATGTALASAELYDRAAGAWSATGSLGIARSGHSATLLASGEVLVVGGFSTVNGQLRGGDNELYNPNTQTWTTAPPEGVGGGDTATLLDSGRVLFAGGATQDGAAEVYDPIAAAWFSGGVMTTERHDHTATLLPSGLVLAAGGTDGQGFISLASAEVYDPSALVISPPMASVPPKGSQAFAVTGGTYGGYTWSLADNASGGTLGPSGMYTAGARGGVTDAVAVRDSGGHVISALVTVGPSISIYPPSPTVEPREVAGFYASGGGGSAYQWSFIRNASGATLDTSNPGYAQYTAGPTPGLTDELGVTDSLGNSAEVTITVGGGPQISPPTATVAPSGSQAFTASGGNNSLYLWAFVTNASGGSLDGNGFYTAGATGNVTDVIQVTDFLGGVGTASVSVTAAVAQAPAASGGGCASTSNTRGVLPLLVVVAWSCARGRRSRSRQAPRR